MASIYITKKSYLKMAKQLNISVYEKPTVSRKGVHAKSKTSVNKSSANYKKPYKGQGK